MTIDKIAELIADVPDFPKPGIIFKDITPILADKIAFPSLVKLFVEQVPTGVNKLMAIESRGFILASAMAQHRPFSVVLVRKPGKLPRKTLRFEYDLEYGSDVLEIHEDSVESGESVALIDDVLATGGTAHAAEQLVAQAGGRVVKSCFLMEIEGLGGGRKLKSPYHSFLKV